MRARPALLFGVEAALLAADRWGMTCGPAALAAALGRPLFAVDALPGYAEKRYMNPSMMQAALDHLGARWLLTKSSFPHGMHQQGGALFWQELGVSRVQWGGPWMAPRVPEAARYQRTHWIAVHRDSAERVSIFDINAIERGGWLSLAEWASEIVPEIVKEIRNADGLWSITHRYEVIS